MERYRNKTVLVTGGNSGIGYAAAQRFIQEGARVIITGRDEQRLAQAVAELGERSSAIRNDAGQPGAAAALAAELAARHVRLDAIFVNAGVARLAPFESFTEADWDAIFDTNVKGAYFMLQALLPLLNAGAAVVLNGSINAHIGMAHSSIYGASKAALISLARTLSAELVARGVRVNVVSPGPVRTPLYGKLGIPDTQLPAVASQIEAQVPLRRFGEVEEVAAAVAFLASDEAAYMVGSELIVDGGMSQL